MTWFSLVWAVLAPWLVGALCLRAVARRTAAGSLSTAVIVGFGLFVGYAILYGLILLCNALSGGVSFALVSAGLAAVGAAGAVLGAAPARRTAPPLPALAERPFLLGLLVAAAAAHLVFTAVELLHLPVFPWDAWGSWMYRARIWFHAGELLAIARPDEWLAGSQLTYNATAAHYPGLLPALAMWCALALGRWSETLINLPTLACGIALGVGMYAQCRNFGTPRWVAALGAYALLSLPLVGVHLSLAGYADIWMAGFTGLGLAALLNGIVREQRAQLLLGLLMLACGIAVKREGGVWFTAGLLILALNALPGRLLQVAGALLLLAGGALWLTGTGYLDLPLLGPVGFADERLYVPLLGSFAVKHYDLWDNYLHNFIAGGSWHLLWSLVALAILALPFLPAGRIRRAAASFFLAALAAQFLMFQITELGMWVEDGTVVNRLPLQMAPAYVFAVLMVLHTLGAPAGGPRRRRVDWRIPAAGLAAVLLVLVLRVPGSGDAASVEALRFGAADLQVVVGAGEAEDGALAVSGYSDGIAVLSSGELAVDTEQFALLRLETRGDSTRQVTVFWRSADDPAEIRSINVDYPGLHWIDLAAVPEWEGRIMELGIVAYEDGPRRVSVHALEVLPATTAARWRKLRADWSQHDFWSQRSVNAVVVKPTASVLSLPALAAVWLFAAVLMAALLRFSPAARAALLLSALLPWLLLDARWLLNRGAQAAQTVRSYPLATARYIDFGDDQTTLAVVAAARPFIGAAATPTIIVSEAPQRRFRLLRARYLAAPAPAYANLGPARLAPFERGGFLLVLREYPAPPGYRPVPAGQWVRLVRRAGRDATLLWESPDGLLFSLDATPEAPDGS